MIKGLNVTDGSCRSIQLVVVHLPSIFGRTSEDIEQATRSFAEKGRGQRRNEAIVGTGANFELYATQAAQGIAGRAFSRIGSTPSSTAREVMTELIQQIASLKLREINTLDRWWLKLSMPSPPARSTCGGKVYGHYK